MLVQTLSFEATSPFYTRKLPSKFCNYLSFVILQQLTHLYSIRLGGGGGYGGGGGGCEFKVSHEAEPGSPTGDTACPGTLSMGAWVDRSST
jgi:hypothetical protein